MEKCPECGSSRIEQYMMPYGPMWCVDCGFRVEDKTASTNPFISAEDRDQAAPSQIEQDRPMLGEQLSAWQEAKRSKER